MFETFFGSGMPLSARFFIAFVIVLGLIGLAAWFVRRFGANRFGGARARGRQPRLAIIDASVIDGRRRLVLIRRDNIEHLLMIGGPSDLLIEANIVRAAPARETSIHAVPAADNNWPLQPFNEPTTVQRNYPRSEPGPRAPITAIAGTASDKKNAGPNDHNLAEMALQLEASLRRKPKGDTRPSVPDPLTTLYAKPAEPALRTPMRELKPSFESQAGSSTDPRFEPRLNIQPEPEFEPKSSLASDLVTNVQPQFGPEATAASSKQDYDSLEEEMASLLGRPKKS